MRQGAQSTRLALRQLAVDKKPPHPLPTDSGRMIQGRADQLRSSENQSMTFMCVRSKQ
jgi:hypothetical protein